MFVWQHTLYEVKKAVLVVILVFDKYGLCFFS